MPVTVSIATPDEDVCRVFGDLLWQDPRQALKPDPAFFGARQRCLAETLLVAFALRERPKLLRVIPV